MLCMLLIMSYCLFCRFVEFENAAQKHAHDHSTTIMVSTTKKKNKKNKNKKKKKGVDDDDDDDDDNSSLSNDSETSEDEFLREIERAQTDTNNRTATTARQRAKLGLDQLNSGVGNQQQQQHKHKHKQEVVSLMQLDYDPSSKRRPLKEGAEAEAEILRKKAHNLKLSKEYNKRKKKEKREAIMAKMFTATQKRGEKEELIIKEQAENRLKEKNIKRESKYPELGYIRHVSSAKNGSFLILPENVKTGEDRKKILSM